jgi:glycosyltransferase involved in cell wall biosynthesis
MSQQYADFRVIITDDCSTDGGGDQIESLIERKNFGNVVTLIRNPERLGAMANMYNMYRMCDDKEIIVHIDGDDWLAHDKVFQKLNEVYQDQNIWLTYGQHQLYPDGGLGCSREIPKHVIDKNSFRRFRWCSSHLRTFYAALAKNICMIDCMINGEFYPMTSDLATMFPMLEMAGHHQKFIPDILYIYNYSSDINDAKVNIKLQQNLERFIRSKPSYSKLEAL